MIAASIIEFKSVVLVDSVNLMIILVSTIAVRLWRGTPAIVDARRIARYAWVLPLSWLDAISRAFIPGLLVFGIASLISLLTELARIHGSSAFSAETLAVANKVAGGLVLICIMLVVLPIVLFNRPKSLVPRGMRNEPGLVLVGIQAVRRVIKSRKV